MNYTAFFASLRLRESGAFGTSLSQGQVDGVEAILTAGQGLPLSHSDAIKALAASGVGCLERLAMTIGVIVWRWR